MATLEGDIQTLGFFLPSFAFWLLGGEQLPALSNPTTRNHLITGPKEMRAIKHGLKSMSSNKPLLFTSWHREAFGHSEESWKYCPASHVDRRTLLGKPVSLLPDLCEPFFSS